MPVLSPDALMLLISRGMEAGRAQDSIKKYKQQLLHTVAGTRVTATSFKALTVSLTCDLNKSAAIEIHQSHPINQGQHPSPEKSWIILIFMLMKELQKVDFHGTLVHLSYYNQMSEFGGFKKLTFTSHNSEARKSRISMVAGLIAGEPSLHRLSFFVFSNT